MKSCEYVSRAQYYKTINICNLRVFVIGNSVFPDIPFQSILYGQEPTLELSFSWVDSPFTYKH
jgi:hypothetical protein